MSKPDLWYLYFVIYRKYSYLRGVLIKSIN